MINLLNFLPFRFNAPEIKMCRLYNNERYCISRLFDKQSGKYICDAIEDTVRDNNHNGTFDNGEIKVYGKTAIPCGRYYVTFRKTNLAIGKKAADGCIPFVHDVPHFTDIRMHDGETEENSEGCILLGYNKVRGRVVQSEEVCLAFFQRMKYRPFWLEISDDFAY